MYEIYRRNGLLFWFCSWVEEPGTLEARGFFRVVDLLAAEVLLYLLLEILVVSSKEESC